MIDSNSAVVSLGNAELLAATREILRRGCVVEADLLVHLAEIEERRLHSEMAFPTMFAFCVDELGFSEDQAYNRTTVARAARRIPAMLDSLRSGAVHLTGLRLLARCLTEQNHRDVLAEASGKSKRQIEEIVARFDPKPPVPDSFRKRPLRKQVTLGMTSPVALPRAPRREQRAVVAPVSEDTFTVQFTASTALRDKFRRAQDLRRTALLPLANRAPKQPKLRGLRLRGRYLRRSGATSTHATADAARSSTHVATDARRQASSSSITWTGLPARTCTIRNESSSGAARITSTRQRRCTDASSWPRLARRGQLRPQLRSRYLHREGVGTPLTMVTADIASRGAILHKDFRDARMHLDLSFRPRSARRSRRRGRPRSRPGRIDLGRRPARR